MGNQREILTGAVLACIRRRHDPREHARRNDGEPSATAMLRVKDERDEALKLLRRTLELREIGAEGPHKSDIRAFFVRLGEPVAMTRGARQQSLERAIVAFNPDTTEALELLASFSRALTDRYGDGDVRTADLRTGWSLCLDDVRGGAGRGRGRAILRDRGTVL
jgi:hypothetical protein